jgi:hypothetical protein
MAKLFAARLSLNFTQATSLDKTVGIKNFTINMSATTGSYFLLNIKPATRIKLNIESLGLELTSATTYSIVVNEGFVVDASDATKTSPPQTISYVTDAGPSIQSVIPNNPAKGDKLILVYNYKVKASALENIYLYKNGTPDVLIKTYKTTTSGGSYGPQPIISNKTVTLKTAGYMMENSSYYILAGAGAVQDYTNSSNSLATTDKTKFPIITNDINFNGLRSNITSAFTLALYNTYNIFNDTPITGTTNQFGNSVAASINYMVIAQPYDDNLSYNSTTNFGKVRIYDQVGSSLVSTLNPPDIATPSDFGRSVSISEGGKLAVGDRVKVHLYNIGSSTPFLQITSPSDASYGYFGHGVKIDDSIVMISEQAASGNSSTIQAKVHVYSHSGTLLNTINNLGSSFEIGDNYPVHSYKMSISDTYYAVAFERTTSSGAEGGFVYIYNKTTHALVRTLTNTTTGFGSSIAISGDKIAVGGCPRTVTSVDANSLNSRAYLYSISTGTLLTTFTDPNPDTTSHTTVYYNTTAFGRFVAIENSILFISSGKMFTTVTFTTGTQTPRIYMYNLLDSSLVFTKDAAFLYHEMDTSKVGIITAHGNNTLGYSDYGKAKAFRYSTA